MIKKYQKSVYVVICLVFFLAIGFLNLSINRVSAAGLEIQYPTISGTTIGANTKLPDYVKYLFNLGMFLGFFSVFISLVIAGVMYFLSPIKPDYLSYAKDRISGAISGLLILALTYLIIATINPQLNFLSSNELPPGPQPPEEKKASGVYFYSDSGCSDKNIQPNTLSTPDLGELKNKVSSVNVVQDADTQTSYISILYDKTGLWGKCQYLNPDQKSCQTVDPFSASASIHKYDFNPNGDGVYFYRKSFFNDKGGSLKITNSQIGPMYIKKLDELKFQNVPEDEQDCIKYSDNGECAQNGKTPQSLGGENISSIKINGDYLVLLTYAGPGQSCYDVINTSCQEFPTIDDTNRLGPQQMKWQNIRNSGGVIPNCIIIIPIQR
jgi:hypothetical protein